MIYALLAVAVLSFGILVVGWVTYPSQMAKAGRRPPVPTAAQSIVPSSISVILATRESDNAIVDRIADLLRSDFPRESMEIVVALDATRAEGVPDLIKKLPTGTVVVHGDAAGKSSALNAGVAVASNELLLFVDTAQTFEPDTIRKLVTAAIVEGWGAVTATLAPTSGDALMDRYWQRELAIRLGQASRHSIICVTGCAYVMHRRYWRNMPVGLICDDLWSTYSVVTAGARVGIVTDAHVTDPRRFTRDEEYARRRRTITGMMQFMRWFPDVLRPSRNPMFMDFLLHKVTRPATPVLLITGLFATWLVVMLLSVSVGLALAASGLSLVLAVYVLARFGRGSLGARARGLMFAQRLLLMPLTAIGSAVRSDWDVWKPHR